MSASVTLAGQRAEDSLRLRSGQFPRDIANPLVVEQDPADEPVCRRCGASHRAWVPEDADKSDAEADVEAGAVAKADVDVDADFDAAVDASMDDEVRAGTVLCMPLQMPTTTQQLPTWTAIWMPTNKSYGSRRGGPPSGDRDAQRAASSSSDPRTRSGECCPECG